jgi:hypothetical protein
MPSHQTLIVHEYYGIDPSYLSGYPMQLDKSANNYPKS